MKSFNEIRGTISEAKNEKDLTKTVESKLKQIGVPKSYWPKINNSDTVDNRPTKKKYKVPKEMTSLFDEISLGVSASYYEGNAMIVVEWSYKHPGGGSNGKSTMYRFLGGKWES